MPWSDMMKSLIARNDKDFGLQPTIWTYDFNNAMKAVKRWMAGFVQINQNAVGATRSFYGGFKNQASAGSTLEAMLEHFTRKKTVIMNMVGCDVEVHDLYAHP